MPREIITFQCTECKNRNYTSTKNKKTTTERLELKKFCHHCRKRQVHKDGISCGLRPRNRPEPDAAATSKSRNVLAGLDR